MGTETARASDRLTTPGVTEALRDDIRRGRFHPRERLVEADLAEMYGVKRASIRTALIQLAGEGLVERQPNRGARVRQVSIDEAIQITEVRLALQAMCTAKAAEKGSDEDRTLLLEEIATLRGAVARNDQPGYTSANARIAEIIRRMGGHTIANGIIDQLTIHYARPAFPFMLPERRMESLREFEAMVDAVVARDPDAAYAATIRHMQNVLAALRAIRDAEPSAI